MSVAVPVYSNLALQWTPESKQNRGFNILAAGILIGAMIIALLLSSIPLPKEDRKAVAPIPERVARFIEQRPKPEVKKPEPKQEPKPIVQRIKRERPDEKKPLTKTEEKARQKAAKSGLLALGKDLADLMDTSSVSKMVGKRVTKAGDAAKANTVNTAQLTANSGQGSGGVSTQQYTANVSKTVLSEQEKIEIRQAIKKGAGDGAAETPSGTHRVGDVIRTEEEIKLVLDQNKSSLHALYRQARRKNPGLKGKLVLLITIQPSGIVSEVSVKSSELNDPSLEQRIVARVKQFTFGTSKAVPVTITFPIEFLPS